MERMETANRQTLAFDVPFQRNSRFGNDGLIYWCPSISKKGVPVKREEFSTEPSRYRSYVLRCWQEHTAHAGQGATVWRFSLHDPRTHQLRGFATLEALMVCLQEELADDSYD